ncbi:Uncharacterised protein [Mycobacteroides abscessus subsp. massiliense]|nr:Uncharacterised protein [Mycobacteroides abscessus subsp. massiliense]
MLVAGSLKPTYLHFMSIFPFPNHAAFADRIKALRTSELAGRNISTPAIEQAGGPSTSHQGRIETYTTMPITREVITQYDQALTKLAGESISAGFITALAAAYGAAHQAATVEAAAEQGGAGDNDTEIRSSLIDITARRHTPDLIYIGVDVDTKRPVYATVVRRGPHRVVSRIDEERERTAFEFGDFNPGTYLPRLANASHQLFSKTLVHMARRHPGITLASDKELANKGQTLPELWDAAGGEVHCNVEASIDPIAGISTLKQARARAKILMQGSSKPGAADELSLAWMILFANAIGESSGCGALDAYIRYRNSDKWKELRAQLPSHVTGGFSSTDNMKITATQYLGGWASARTEPQFETSFKLDTPGGRIIWHNEEVKTSYDIPITAGDLWLEDKSLDVPLADVLHALGTYSLRINDDVLSVTKPAADVEQISYSWYPSGISDRFAIVHRKETGWRALQIY